MRRLAALTFAVWTSLTLAAHAQGTLRVYGDYPNITVTGTLTETILASVPIPANALGPNGLARLTVTTSNNNSANTKTFLNRFGSTPGAGAGNGANMGTTQPTTNITQQYVLMLRNTGATNAQVAYGTIGAPYGTGTVANTTSAVDTTAISYINITGTLTNVADSVTLNGWTLEIIRP